MLAQLAGGKILVGPPCLMPEAMSTCRVANAMATSGRAWADIVAQHNSGTYNNQYMVVDLKLFRPGHELQADTLWVVEQLPGMTVAADQTQVRRIACLHPPTSMALRTMGVAMPAWRNRQLPGSLVMMHWEARRWLWHRHVGSWTAHLEAVHVPPCGSGRAAVRTALVGHPRLFCL